MIKRHHPITVIYKIYSQIRYSIIPLAAFLYNEIRAGTGQQPDWVYLVATVYGVVTGCWSILSWFRETYQLDFKELHITKGVFTVTQRTIPFMKINNIRIEQSWLYRLLGIANVELQTSDSNADADARLVTSQKMAELLKKSIRLIENQSVIPLTIEHHVTRKEIMMLSMSSNTFWLGLPVTIAVIQHLWSWLFPTPEEEEVSFMELFKKETWSRITLDDSIEVALYLVAYLGICVIVTWLFSIGMAQFRYKGWHLTRAGDVISIHHGWMERKSVQIQVERIQSIQIKELMIGRLYGYASVCMDCVGYSGERRVKLLIPSIHTSELVEVLGRLLPEFQLQTLERALHRNAKFATAIPVISLLVLGIIVGCYFTLLYLTIVPVLYIVYKYMTYVYVNTKWEIAVNLFMLRKAGFNQTTVYLLRESVESISIRQSWWQRLFRVYQLEMDIDSPANVREYRIAGMTKQYCDEILRWYKNKRY
ncbi:PH domain-containing protein [Paenibacillus filicis]|uniref:PH domain-containing protein n=1 Tax=Paenibacillus gyeongsangnamensis TaxID=3388067 RepID=A0ABT4Q3M1_9BACL|nr:PH domain-containing protein [Paenibacillus filicis]MCZ8511482.1 PH domain-containing protein [Paenibacillus filicis]